MLLIYEKNPVFMIKDKSHIIKISKLMNIIIKLIDNWIIFNINAYFLKLFLVREFNIQLEKHIL